MTLDHSALAAAVDSLMDDDATGNAAATAADAPSAGKGKKKSAKKKKKARKKKTRASRGRRPGTSTATKKKPAANGRKKTKKKKKTGARSGNGRKERGPSRKTVEKQNYIREMLRVNPQQSINQSIEAVKKKFDTTIQFERAREVHEEFGPIRRGRRGGAAPTGASAARAAAGRGRRAASGKGGEYVVTVSHGRGRVDARTFDTPAQVTDYVNKLTQRDGVPLQDIGFYQRFEPEISVRF